LNVRRLLFLATPIVAIIIAIAVIIAGTIREKIDGLEFSALLLSAFFVYTGRGSVSRNGGSIHISSAIHSSELVCLGLALFSAMFSADYARPILFFVFMILFYLLLFVEAYSFSSSTGAFVLKLLFGQALLIGSFASLYYGFVGVDSYRDYAIATSIINSAGGLPKPFVQLIWYDATPTAPLSYAIAHLIVGMNLRDSELMLGFIFSWLPILAIGVLSLRITRDKKQSLLSMWFASLMPLFWIWATWPIPEMMAVSFVLLALMVFLQGNKTASLIMSVLFGVLTVFTHGGMSLILIVSMFFIFFMTRLRLALLSGFMALIAFFTYSAYVSVIETQYGLATLSLFVNAVLSKGSQATVASQGIIPGLSGFLDQVSLTFSWIALAVLVWIGILSVGKSFPRRRLVLSISLIVFACLGLANLFQVVGSSTDTSRYIGLIGYPLMAIVASLGLFSMPPSLRKRIFVSIMIAIFVVSVVLNPYISPDIWLGNRQASFAATFRLQTSTTLQELSSQVFLNNFDHSYAVESNYVPMFTNLTLPANSTIVPFPALFQTIYTMQGVVAPKFSKVPPYVLLLTARSDQLNYTFAVNPASKAILTNPDIIYESPISTIIVVTQNASSRP
jgi:hypothetical protein